MWVNFILGQIPVEVDPKPKSFKERPISTCHQKGGFNLRTSFLKSTLWFTYFLFSCTHCTQSYPKDKMYCAILQGTSIQL